MEPNEWLIREGIARELGEDVLRVKEPHFSTIDDFSYTSLGKNFDFVLAQSIFSHTFDDLAERALTGIANCLSAGGVLLATFLEAEKARDGSGWSYPDCVYYEWTEIQDLAQRAGLAVMRLRWPHPKQHWFVGSATDSRAEEVVARIADGFPT